MSTIIRFAEPSDLPAMVDLLGELFAIEADFHPDPVRQHHGLRLLLEAPGARVWVAEEEERVLGMITLQILVSTAEGGPVGLIEDVVVTTARRGRGLGRELLAAAEDWAAENGLRRLQLLADRNNGPALDFYRRRGWCSTNLIALHKTGNI